MLNAILSRDTYRYTKGVDAKSLSTIRQWEYGILLIEASECRGVDTRFSVDATVLIVAKVETNHQLQ